MNRPVRLAARVAVAVVPLAGVVVATDTRTSIDRIIQILDMLRGGGAYSCLAFILFQMMAVMIGVLPASLIGMAAGLTYGLWGGFSLAATGTLLGGWIAFMLSRSMFRPWVMAILNRSRRMEHLDHAVVAGNWRFVCLLRLSPIMPFSLTSYALGLTRIDQKSYMLGTLASMPALLAYVAMGAFAHSGFSVIAGHMSISRSIPLGVGIVATIAAGLYLRRLILRTVVEPELQPSPAA